MVKSGVLLLSLSVCVFVCAVKVWRHRTRFLWWITQTGEVNLHTDDLVTQEVLLFFSLFDIMVETLGWQFVKWNFYIFYSKMDIFFKLFFLLLDDRSTTTSTKKRGGKTTEKNPMVHDSRLGRWVLRFVCRRKKNLLNDDSSTDTGGVYTTTDTNRQTDKDTRKANNK